MANFIIRYRVSEKSSNVTKKYNSSVHIIADSLQDAKEIVTDSYINTEETIYDINFL